MAARVKNRFDGEWEGGIRCEGREEGMRRVKREKREKERNTSQAERWRKECRGTL